MLNKEDKFWSWCGIILMCGGIIGINEIVSGLLGNDCTLKVDTFAVGIGLILWRMSAKD